MNEETKSIMPALETLKQLQSQLETVITTTALREMTEGERLNFAEKYGPNSIIIGDYLIQRISRKPEIKIPECVWIVSWHDQRTQATGVSAVFQEEGRARTYTELCNSNTGNGSVFKATCWPVG
jgi:trehalose/maltose hydrolase-like predicted phosphorylase